MGGHVPLDLARHHDIALAYDITDDRAGYRDIGRGIYGAFDHHILGDHGFLVFHFNATANGTLVPCHALRARRDARMILDFLIAFLSDRRVRDGRLENKLSTILVRGGESPIYEVFDSFGKIAALLHRFSPFLEGAIQSG
jgi:hypothetical protein